MSRKRKVKKYIRPSVFNLQAKNESQKRYIRSIYENELTIVDGPAGTGKSFISSVLAARMYDEGTVNRIILTRPNVPSSRSLGAFPGSLLDKMDPWVAPIMSTLKEVLQPGTIETGLKKGNIDIVPFEVMRGRSFENAFIILDEAQNTTYHEMKMFLTRLGENCKTVVNGDTEQTDLNPDYETGLDAAFRLGADISGVGLIHFDEEDIVRSGMCAEWVKAFRND